jgi:hypothetical protein
MLCQGISDLVRTFEYITSERDLLRAFYYADDSELEWEVQQRPYLLANGAVVSVREVVEVAVESLV